jgi:hypothetical protein
VVVSAGGWCGSEDGLRSQEKGRIDKRSLVFVWKAIGIDLSRNRQKRSQSAFQQFTRFLSAVHHPSLMTDSFTTAIARKAADRRIVRQNDDLEGRC